METCSRCGRAMDKPTGYITFHDYSNYPVSADRSDMELCPSCTAKFREWKSLS